MERLTEWTGYEWIPRQERLKGKIVGHRQCMERLAAYENTELLPEEINLLMQNLEKNVCVGCWLKDEATTAGKIEYLNKRIEVAITELENLKKCYMGSEVADMKAISFEDYIQEIIDSLN